MPNTAKPTGDLGRGYVVLAAYRPDPALFERQITSIQRQTVSNFECLVTADGDPDEVARQLRKITDNDDRFRVIGYDDRLGFYGNFERGLEAVPKDAAWVALADQDDRWDATKLEQLLPHLAQFAVVSCQARVIRYPGDSVIAPSTARKDSPVESFTLDNQFTGSQMVFRRDVLDAALPFPRLHTPAQVHDHWIAVVGHFLGGAKVLPMIAQDYVQHGANVIGEANRGFDLAASIRNARQIARKYRNGTSLRAMAHVTYDVGVGWREAMVTTLAQRVPHVNTAHVQRLYGPERSFWRTTRYLAGAVRRREVSLRSAVEYGAGWIAGALFHFRRR